MQNGGPDAKTPSPVPKRPLGYRVAAKLRSLVLTTALILFGWVLLEGVSSTLLLVSDVVRISRGPLAERVHTRYDELLGWVNIENVTIENLYGEGIHLRTNSQGFRANEDYRVAPPVGKMRIICSGDSFTLGYGVGNDHTWCQLLSSRDSRFQTVNMGQGGYGIDQAYLWYEHDGSRLDHDVHLFSFITADFWRMRQRSFHGYGKPFLELKNGELFVENVPVPRAPFYAPWFARNFHILDRLRSVQLLRWLLPGSAANGLPTATKTRAVLLKVIEELRALNDSKDTLLVVVLLPTQADYDSDDSRELRGFLHRELPAREIVFLDLIRAIRKVPPRNLQSLFIPRGSSAHEAAGGHYSVKGNGFIAARVHEALLALPEISSRLEELELQP